MAWITLSLRKQDLKAQTNEMETRDLSLSREKRSIQRNLAYQKSIIEAEEGAELHKIKDEYNKIKDTRPMSVTVDGEVYYFDTKKQYKEWRKEHPNSNEKPEVGKKGCFGSYTLPTGDEEHDKDIDTSSKEEYNEKLNTWKETTYEIGKEAYEEQKELIEDMADDAKEEIEDEATRKQSNVEEEQTILESNLQDLNQELQTVSEQISTDVQSSAIKFN